jgi:lipoprotein-anchoring transpeptidase ErfK/SrfK
MKRLPIFIILGAVILLLIILAVAFGGKKSTEETVSIAVVDLSQAKELLDKGDLIKARQIYKDAMSQLQDPERLKQVKKTIEDLNIEIIFSTLIDECSQTYTVKSGDSLAKIANKFDTTVNLIKRANNLKSNIIRPGQRLKVNTCVFSLVVDKSQNILLLNRKDEIVKTYIVSTGEDNSTPVGTFKIVNKIVDPAWFRVGAVIPAGSPENILGSRWMGFDVQGYGIHGTTDPDNLGKQVTMGCVRMRNEEVEELFDLIPTGTEIIIID